MKVNPLDVLLFNLVLPIAIMFPGNRYRHYFFLIFAFCILLVTLKFKRAFKFLLVYAVLTVIHQAILAFPSDIGQFFYMLIIMGIQFIPCLMMASVLILDYSPTQIISALEPLHLPKTFVVALAIVVRYIPTFKREFKYIKESMRLRNIPYSIKRPVKSFEFFMVPQLFRCAILADEITAAGLSKGITNPVKRTSYHRVKMGAFDYIACLTLLVWTGVFIVWR